ncbi:NYN domain-containing protein [Roseovarius sp. A21]|uniref:NYN domain-containing protein n=1 Tax=Roseovarius bejariae TaxID=2576383 RepID=A0A844CI44_9RHOB|nr:NYN domain-containing protein [Roseovarius bejariae]MRU14991.1 NYN domain-containing protein [Roseovarius bejariae]
MATPRVAVLVDGDNVSAKFAESIHEAADSLGRVDVARVYAAVDKPSEWQTMPGFRCMGAGVGKNAADLLLSIDAMELALEQGIECFVVSSSDNDFTHLAQRLRERGLYVLGLGEEKAPVMFRAACSSFKLLTNEPPAKCVANLNGGASAFDCEIRKVIATNSQNGSGVSIVQLATLMRQKHGTKISEYPEKTWRRYLSKRPALYDLDPKGAEAKVRFRPDGFYQH